MNTLCGQNVEMLNVNLVVHIVITGLHRVKIGLYKPVGLSCKGISLFVLRSTITQNYTEWAGRTILEF